MKTKPTRPIRTRRPRAVLVLLTLISLAVAAPVALQGATLAELLERGVYSEETKGDLDAAMESYRRIVEEAESGQPVAAQAQYRLGVCHYKKGQYEEARIAFEKLIRDFADQKELVRLAGEYLTGAVNLRPAPWVDGEVLHLDLKTSTGFKVGYVRYSAESDALDGRRIWRLGTVLVAGPKHVSRVEVEADTFKPIHSRWRHNLLGEALTTYTSGGAEVKLHNATEPKSVELSGIRYDNEEVVQLIRRLPLEPGYRTTLPVFTSLGGAQIVPIGLEVRDPETIQVPAGTFECYPVVLSLVNQTFWYATDAHRYLTKFDAGGVVAELTSVEHRQSGERSVVDDSAFDFELGQAGGGVPTVQGLNQQPPQDQAKVLILTAARMGKLPAAANWCEALNESGSRFPEVPKDTRFALNTQVAGCELSGLAPETVVFFETTQPGWNKSGGAEMLAQNPTGVAVAFADGRALLMAPDEATKLRWAR